MIKPLLSAAVLCAVSLPVPAAIIDAQVTGFTPGQERVLSSVVNFWERSIRDNFTFKLSISMLNLDGDFLGSTFAFTQNAGGLPVEAAMEIDNRVGSFIGWFVDPTPDLNEEFVRGSTPFDMLGRPATPAGQNYDLKTVLHHEVAHALGFTVNYSRFGSRLSLRDDGLRNYKGKKDTAVLTAEYEGTHLSDFYHPDDLMNPYQNRGQRRLPSTLDLTILSDAFNYTLAQETPIPEPSSMMLAGVAFLIAGVVRSTARRLW
jgi:hypothetical protein